MTRPTSAGAWVMLVLAVVVVGLVVAHYAVGLAVVLVAGKVMTRGRGGSRRRPRSSWAQLVEAWSLLLVAWNTRRMVQPVAAVRAGFRSNVPTRRRRS